MNPTPETFPLISCTPAKDAGQRLGWILRGTHDPVQIDSSVESILTRAERGELSLAGLLQAHQANRLVGTGWGQCLPGRLGVIWPIRLAPDTADEVGERLLESIQSLEAFAQVQLWASLPPATSDVATARHCQLLSGVGFEHATDLISLTLPLASIKNPGRAPLDLVDAVDSDRLESELKQAEVDSLDVPELHGFRESSDLLATFRDEARADQRGWFFVRHGESTRGCLLLAHHPRTRSATLQFMGLRVDSRGRGWGRLLVQLAAQWAAQRKAQQLTLMVDRRNQPARRVYLAAGMIEFERRSLWIRKVEHTDAGKGLQS